MCLRSRQLLLHNRLGRILRGRGVVIRLRASRLLSIGALRGSRYVTGGGAQARAEQLTHTSFGQRARLHLPFVLVLLGVQILIF